MKSVLNALCLLALVCFTSSTFTATYQVSGNGNLGGSFGGQAIVGTWSVQGTAQYTHGSDLSINNANLELAGTAPINATVNYNWNSLALDLGGNDLGGSADLSNCQSGLGCVFGDTTLDLSLSHSGGLQWNLTALDNAGTEGDYLSLNGQLQLSQVPLPAAAWLFASAILALGINGRRSQRA